MDNDELIEILHTAPELVSSAWQDMQKAQQKEDAAFARAYLSAKNKGIKVSIDDAKQIATLDEEYLDAYVKRVELEAIHKKLYDGQINARKIAELVKAGI